MRPGWMLIRSWVRTASTGPQRFRISGSRKGLKGETCRTTKIDAGKSPGRDLASVWRASTPPDEAPMTMMSRRSMHPVEGRPARRVMGNRLIK